MKLLRTCLLFTGLALAGCASDPIDSHPAYPEIQRQVATIIQSVRTGTGATLFADLRRLVAYDVFAVDQVVELAKDENARLRSNAMYVLAQIRDVEQKNRMERVEETLREGLEDSDATVRFEAATGLAARGEWDVLPVLIDGLDHPDSGVRYRCHEQLCSTTSRDFGYSIDAEPVERQAAVDQWRSWYAGWQKTGG